MRLFSARVQQEIIGYATGLTLLGSVIGVLVIVGGLELPEQAKNAVNAMATVLILIMAYMARSYVVHQPSKSYAHVMQIFENGKHAWEIHGVVERMIPLSDEEVQEAIKPFRLDLSNSHIYGVKYSNVTVLGDQSFTGQGFVFNYALMAMDVESGQLYGEGISHEILYRGFPAPVRCAFLVADILSLHRVERVKGVTEQDWIPVFQVRHGPYHSEGEKRFKALPLANPELIAVSKQLTGKIVEVQIQDKVFKKMREAREEGIEIGEEEGASAIEEFEGVLKPGLHIPNPKKHKLGYAIIGVALAFLIAGYLIGWFRIG